MPIETNEDGEVVGIMLTAGDIVHIMHQGAKGAVFMALLLKVGSMKRVPECQGAFTNSDQADKFQHDCLGYYQDGLN